MALIPAPPSIASHTRYGLVKANPYYEVDFRAQPNLAMPSNNTEYTIDGKPWKTRNRTLASVCEVQNGTGLVINVTSGYPAVICPWTSMFSGLTHPFGLRVRAMAWIVGTLGVANHAWLRMAFEDYTATNWTSIFNGRRHSTDTTPYEHWNTYVNTLNISSSNLTDNVYVMTFNGSLTYCFSGMMNGESWPELSALTWRGLPANQAAPVAGVTWNPAVSFSPGEPGTAMTIKKLRVEIY